MRASAVKFKSAGHERVWDSEIKSTSREIPFGRNPRETPQIRQRSQVVRGGHWGVNEMRGGHWG